jgi:hypothetical protein
LNSNPEHVAEHHHFSRCIFTAFNSNTGKSLPYNLHSNDNLGCTGVIKSIVGEITDHTNSADAFAMLHVPWAIGTSFGYDKHLSLET